MNAARRVLVDELREHALVIGTVVLTSGRTAEYLVDAKPLSKVRGQPFTIGEIKRGVKQILAGEAPMLKAVSVDKGAVGGG